MTTESISEPKELETLIKNAHTLADFVHGNPPGPIDALHTAIDMLAAAAALGGQQNPIPENAILHRMKYMTRPQEGEDEFALFEMNTHPAECIDVLIVRADQVKVSQQTEHIWCQECGDAIVTQSVQDDVCDAASTQKKFKLGDKVRKLKGSQWRGVVVGTYSTTLTPEGYAVESSTEHGSVQIYPAAALELYDATPVQPGSNTLSILTAIADEYDDLIRHMDAGGDFFEFQVARSKRNTP